MEEPKIQTPLLKFFWLCSWPWHVGPPFGFSGQKGSNYVAVNKYS